MWFLAHPSVSLYFPSSKQVKPNTDSRTSIAAAGYAEVSVPVRLEHSPAKASPERHQLNIPRDRRGKRPAPEGTSSLSIGLVLCADVVSGAPIEFPSSKQVKPNSPNGSSVETGQAQRRSTVSPKSTVHGPSFASLTGASERTLRPS